MNNEELKKKIVDIALHAEWTDMFGDHNSIGKYAANAIADALIAAGIGDVKSLEISDASKEQSSINYYCEMRECKDKCRAAEHRAEVAERALYNLAKEFVDMQGYEKWDIAILAKEIVVPDYIKQAEKELAEEREDENN